MVDVREAGFGASGIGAGGAAGSAEDIFQRRNNDLQLAGKLPAGTFEKRKDVANELERALASNDSMNLFFPEDIQNMDYWMCFRVNQFSLTQKEDIPTTKDIKRIFLPVPLNFGTQYGQTYNTESLGAIGQFGAEFGEKYFRGQSSVTSALASVFAGISDADSIMTTLGNTARKIYQEGPDALAYYSVQLAPEILTALGGELGKFIGVPVLGAAAGAGGAQFVKGTVAGSGVALNPYMAVMYNSPQFRTHQFSWKLIAKSQKESDAIKDIIYTLKYYSAPGIAEGNRHFFTYPQQFDIDLHYENYLFNIAPSVLTNMEVSYHGEGYPAYHDIGGGADKAPVSITLQCTFQETSIVTKETISSQNR